MKKHIVQSGNQLKSVQYGVLHKLNKGEPLTGVCSYCFEDVIFRVIGINNVNTLACTRCLKSARLYKTEPLEVNRMLMDRALNKTEKFKRFFMRVENYFKGNHVYYPFNIRRKSKWGLKITSAVIRYKGI